MSKLNEKDFTYKLIDRLMNIFGFNKKTASRFLYFFNYYSLHDMLHRILESESKVYTADIVIPTIGVLTVTRDKDNSIIESKIELSDTYKSDIIKTMDGESLFTNLIDEVTVDSIKRKYNNLL